VVTITVNSYLHRIPPGSFGWYFGLPLK